MKTLNEKEMRAIDGGASRTVTCPICKYTRKTGLIERLFWNDARIEMYLTARHYRGYRYDRSKSVHR